MQLILNKKGATLSVRSGRYRITTADAEHWVPPHQVKTITLHPGTKLTHEAVLIAIEHDTDLVLVDGKGFPVARVWSNKFGSIATIRKNQLSFSGSPKAIEWIRGLLLRKADNQLTMLAALGMLNPLAGEAGQKASEGMARLQQKIRHLPANSLHDTFASFRGYEGSLSRVYFETISRLLPEMYRFPRRSQHPALDGFNCLLNYAYGMLYTLVESALIRAGLDPAIGVMHRDEYNRPVLTYDFIEPFRVWADYVVCHLCHQQVIFPEFFDEVEAASGQKAIWLNTAGKRVLIQSFNDYLEEVVTLNDLPRSRQTHIDLEAQQLAKKLKIEN
ncbi:MAG: CRISPR-associated endonuclease Cas1 [Cytophagaceae bacterium]|nr:CRISPR-associated endonuclease Cas1 [Cytophagaceae bacterium]